MQWDSESDWLINAVVSVMRPLATSLPDGVEIVIHDLRKLPNSVVEVIGKASGRQAGDQGTAGWVPTDSATEMLLEGIAHGRGADLLNYSITINDGRIQHSQTTIVRDIAGIPILACCFNTIEYPGADRGVTARPAETATTAGTARRPAGADPAAASGTSAENLDHVDSLVNALIQRAVIAEDVPVAEMKKRHKIRVVERLRAFGVFHLRDSVAVVAEALDVTKFTIYNYLNELDQRSAPEDG
jgi:predicted transcriptional regulator YheO